MIGTGFDVRVKIQDIVASQLPEFILSDSPLTDDFLKQFYVSQEFQGGAVDFASNLDQYLNLKDLTTTSTAPITLQADVDVDDTVIVVDSTKGFPNEWGLLKINDEIITYTGITTNSFTGAIRGFSGVTSYSAPNDPTNLVFETSTAASHASGDNVENLSILFLEEFYKKLKYTFAPGFETIDTSSDVNAATWIQNVRSFFQSKGSEESIKILFKVLYGEDPTVIDLEQFLIKPSSADYNRSDYSVILPIEGNPIKLLGKTVKQTNSDVFGSVSQIEPFVREGQLYFKVFFFVSTEETSRERKEFTVPGRTKAHTSWDPSLQTLTVDSTIGFQDNGEFITLDGTVYKYEEKTVNQFWGVTTDSTDKNIEIGDVITENIFLEGTSDEGETIRVLLEGVINKVDLIDDPNSVSLNEELQVDQLGSNIVSNRVRRNDPTFKDIIANSLIYNTSVRFEVSEVSGTAFSIKNSYLDKAFINVGDFVDILQSGTNTKYASSKLVTEVNFDSAIITVEDITGVPVNVPLDLRRVQKFGSSSEAPIEYGNNAILANVVNLYDATDYDNSLYVATNSLPSYEIESKLSENIINDIDSDNVKNYNPDTDSYEIIVVPRKVKFITGERIVYSVEGGAEPICPEGSYVVEVLANKQFRLYASSSFIGGPSFIPITLTTAPGQHIFTLESQSGRSIKGQRKYVTIPVSENNSSETSDDELKVISDEENIAILTNGVEIKTPKGRDKVFYGPLTSINVISGGDYYDVVTPPTVTVADSQLPNGIGQTAEVSIAMSGTLESILVDPQDFDISEVLSITVTGGNSRGATAEPQVEMRNRTIPFDSRQLDLGGSIDPITNTITFKAPHNLSEGEPLTYDNRGNPSIEIAGNRTLSNGAVYYPEIVNNVTIKLYETAADLAGGINEIDFVQTTSVFGIQDFNTELRPQIVAARILDDGGTFFNRTVSYTGRTNINFELNQIDYPNHGFETGETIVYTGSGNAIQPLVRDDEYLILKVSDDSFRLCELGPTDNPTFNLDREDYVVFTSRGGASATQEFSYPEIVCNIEVTSNNTQSPVVVGTPFIRGSIERVYIQNPGFYGSTILNFEQDPDLTVQSGFGARLNAIVSGGVLLAIQILSQGENYSGAPVLTLVDPTGAGAGAVIRAVVTNGRITDTIIINGGFFYSEDSEIQVVDRGNEAIFQTNLRALTVNQVEKSGFESLANNAYSILSYDRIIRENVYLDNGQEHSPIIGWARDGNPIYGPFAYSEFDNANSPIRPLVSSYKSDSNAIVGRPPFSAYPEGFFIEDYVFDASGDLDIYNGRYCRTPEFPNGIYAYFATVDPADSSDVKTPVFPYFIGDSFRDEARTLVSNLTQDFNINDKPIYRNTFPYAVGNPFIGSEFLDQSYLSDQQNAIVTVLKEGGVDSVDVVGAGRSYSVGDIARFDQTEDLVSAVVSEIQGSEVQQVSLDTLSYSKANTSIIRSTPNEIEIYVDGNHDYIDKDVVRISGLSRELESLNSAPKISVDNSVMSLYAPFKSSGFAGVFDIFVNAISDNVRVGSTIILQGSPNESVEVLNIFPQNKALRVKRSAAYGTDHEVGTIIQVVPSYFTVKDDVTVVNTRQNIDYKFNPLQTIAFGTESGVGVAVTFSIDTIDTTLSLETRRIYAPAHGYRKNEKVTFINPAGFADIVAEDVNGVTYNIPSGEDTFFIERFTKDTIGLKLEKDGEPLFFREPVIPAQVDNSEYALLTNRRVQGCNLDRFSILVDTIQPHNLDSGDVVTLSVDTTRLRGDLNEATVNVVYNANRNVIHVDGKTANSVNFNDNLVNINDHGYTNGTVLFYETIGTAIGGLDVESIYYVIVFDSDNFYLARTPADTVPGSELPIELTSAGSGDQVFSKVNPEIRIVSENTLQFDVSDPSLSGLEFNLFFDEALTKVMVTNGSDSDFIVVYDSVPGQPGARVRVKYSDATPRTFYYGLSRDEIIIEPNRDVVNGSSATYVESRYNNTGTITDISSNTFRLVAIEKVEANSYNIDNNNCTLSYTTNSNKTTGPIADIRVLTTGSNFIKLPTFITVESESGVGAELRAVGSEIGKIDQTRIQNPGWGYYADNSIRPSGRVQPKIEFTDSDFVSSIVVTDGGRGYQAEPTPVLVDSVTKEVINNGSIEFVISSSVITEANVILAPSGMSKNPHDLFTTNNDNGIPVLRVLNVDESTGTAEFEMQTPINGYLTPPFAIGDEVFVENVLADDGQESNLNSPRLDYTFATVTAVLNSNPIRVTVLYLEEYWDKLDNRPVARDQNSFATIVNRNIYPTFQVNQSTALLLVGEALSYINEQGDVISTDLVVETSNENFFKVKGTFDIRIGDVFKGNISGIVVTTTDIENNACTFAIKSTSRLENGWSDSIGFINEETQALPDNDYYQNLSYSIKSTIPFDDLIGPVNKLVHPAGLKNFSDTKIESTGDVGVVGVSSDTITIDLLGVTDVAGTPLRVDRINTYDLGYDAFVANEKSNAIRINAFSNSKKLSDYFTLLTNRVLLMDDISDQFINVSNSSKVNRYVDFNLNGDGMQRVVAQVRNPFTDEVQLVETVMLFDNSAENAVSIQKGVLSSFNELGFGEFRALANKSRIRFTPYAEYVEDTDVDLKLLVGDFVSDSGQDFIDIGFVRLTSTDFNVNPGETVRLYTSRTNASGASLYIQSNRSNSAQGQMRYTELHGFTIGADSYFSEFTSDTTDTKSYSNSNSDLSYTSIRLSGNRVAFDVTNNGTVQQSIKVKTTEYRRQQTGSTIYRFKRESIPAGTERSVNLISTFNNGSTTGPTITLLQLDVNEYQSARCMVQIRGISSIGAIYQVMIARSGTDAYVTAYPFITEGANTDGVGIGEFIAEINGSNLELKFDPDNSISTEAFDAITYAEAFFQDNDYRNYVDLPLEYGTTIENYYLDAYNAPFGLRRDRKSFELTYQGTPIYEKAFEPAEALGSSQTIFSIKDHFFSDLEELYYLPGDSVDGASSPMQINTVTDWEGNVTNQMPAKVWAIKTSLNSFGVAPTLADAQARNFIVVTGFGQGNEHTFGMEKKLEKSLITINGVVQAPLAKTNLTYITDEALNSTEEYITLTGIGTVRSGDILQIEDELVNILDVGFGENAGGPITNTGSVPLIRVERGAGGSIAAPHSIGRVCDLLKGSYNIVNSSVFFTEAPSGKGAIETDESNIVNINATFQGRTFLQKEYDDVRIYDDISNQFNGIENTFEITTDAQQIPEIENGSGILLINDIYQTPSTPNNQGNNYEYQYNSGTGVNEVVFTGITSTNGDRVESEFDVNQNQIPRGGLVVSLASTGGLGYAPLVGAIIDPVVAGGQITGVNVVVPGSGYRGTVNVNVFEEGHSGAVAVIEGVAGAGGALSFNVISPGSGYVAPTLTAPDPNYANLPVRTVFKRDPSAVDGKNLFVTLTPGPSGETGANAKFFRIDTVDVTNQGYGFRVGDVLEVDGLVVDADAPGGVPIEPFQLTVTQTFDDNFSAYNFGELDYIDSIKNLQDGVRTRFPLIYNNTPLSFEIDESDEDSAAIDTDSILLIFVNTVLQVPGESYTFDGGTSFRFLLPPEEEDDIDIYFYRGKRGVDSILVDDVAEKIKPGDEVQLRKNNAISGSKTQNIRTATDIVESDTFRTNIYNGNNDLDENKPRPLAWDKQKRDVFIYGQPVTKVRDSIESIIRPDSAVLRSIQTNSTDILVSNTDLLLYEEELGDQIDSIKCRIYRPSDSFSTAVLQVNMAGDEVDSVTVIDGGSGYPSGTAINFNVSPTGQRATATVSRNNSNVITAVNVTNKGGGYTSTPSYTLTTQNLVYEDIVVNNVQGFTAVITQIEAISGGPQNKRIRFTYETTDPGANSSDLVSPYRISVFNTTVGSGVTALANTTTPIAVGTNFLDCVYQVAGNTPSGNGGVLVVNVSSSTDTSNINAIGDNLGYFSWGRLSNLERESPKTFTVNSSNYSDQLTDYPSIQRRSEGLRNKGGLGKQA